MTQKGNNISRDREICMAYINEQLSSTELAARFKISRTRVNQILLANGLDASTKEATVPRDTYTGVMLTSATKEAVRSEAKKDGKPISTWIAELVDSELTRRGVVPDQHISNEIDLPLPFEREEIR
jgi:hypothetical protein